MTRRFCDLCEAEATGGGVIVKDFGSPWSGYKTSRSGFGCDGTWQPRLWFRLSCGLEDSRDKREQPDLCVKCKVSLLKELIAKFETKEAQ